MSLKTWTLVSFSLILASCQTTSGGGCPPLVTYSLAQQQQAAKELRQISKTQLAKMIVDYKKLRDACRE